MSVTRGRRSKHLLRTRGEPWNLRLRWVAVREGGGDDGGQVGGGGGGGREDGRS